MWELFLKISHLPQQLSRVHSMFHVSNLKKCLSDEPLAVLLDEICIDDKLCFVEEPVEIMDCEVKRLKQSRIPIIKVRWNSRRAVMYSSIVTYTSVYTDSEPGRVFSGADEEPSDGGPPRVIVYGYDGLLMQPVAPPSPDYVDTQPRTAAASPTSLSPFYGGRRSFTVFMRLIAYYKVYDLALSVGHPTYHETPPDRVKMDDPNITMEEYIRLEEEKALSRGETFNWQTATYSKMEYCKDEDDCFSNFESEFPAIVLDDTITSREVISWEPTIKDRLKVERDRQKSYTDKRRKPLEFRVGDHVLLKVLPSKGVIRFGMKGKLVPRFVRPFEIIESVCLVAYRLRLPEELNGVHNTFHVSNLKKCLADPTLKIPLDEIRVDSKLNFVEEPMEILEREFKKLKRSRITIVKHLDQRHHPQRTPPLLPIPLPTPSPPLLLPSTISRASVSEVTLLPQKRLCIVLGLRFEVGESSSAPTARPTGGFRSDYGFFSTLDDEIRQDPKREVGYGITDTWDEMVEDMHGTPTVTDVAGLSHRMTYFVTTVRQDTDEIYRRLDDSQDDRLLMSSQLNMLCKDRHVHAHAARLMENEAKLSHEVWVQSMDASDTACS
ncbi:hypothetical protein Tco_0990042 [Tanacetum coccineum]|uniref:Tf2-1-like SH3-like domain-containing protein n=1 Tax=Tanacetum coccineum TaxID=301880 RepID=A0ABQ5EVD6_9ASTR